MNLLDFVWDGLYCRVSVCAIGNYAPNYYPFNEMRTHLMLPRLLFPHYPSTREYTHSLLQVIIVKYDEAWICPHEISISIDLCDCKRFFSEKRGIFAH